MGVQGKVNTDPRPKHQRKKSYWATLRSQRGTSPAPVSGTAESEKGVVELKVRTIIPEKYRLVDLETGDVWSGTLTSGWLYAGKLRGITWQNTQGRVEGQFTD